MTMVQACPQTDAAKWAGTVIAFGAAIVVTVEFVVIGLSPLMAQTLGMPLEASGRFVVWFAMGSAAMGPFATLVARRLQAHHAMMLSLLPYVASLAVPWLGDPNALCVLRLLQGAALPLYIGVASDTLSSLWRRDDTAVARVYLGVTVGSVLGAPFGVFIARQAGWQGTFVSLGALALLAVVLIGLHPAFRSATPAESSVRSQLAAVARRGVLTQLLLSLVHFAAMFCCYAFLGAILREKDADEGTVGWLLLVFGIGGLAGNLLAGRMTARSTRPLATGTAAVIGLSALSVSHLPEDGAAALPLLLVLLPLWGAAHAASFVVCQLRVVRAAPAAPRLASALNISAANLGIAAGPALGGLALDAGALPALGLAGFGIGLASMLLAAIVGARGRHAAPKQGSGATP